MSDEIGRADYVLGVDKRGVKKGVDEAEREIKASGQRAEADYGRSGERAGIAFSTHLKTAGKVGGLALAGGLGLAAKGVMELEGIQAQFRAETGATADEAERAGKAINDMAGRNMQPLSEIGAALTKVHTDLGLAGDEANAATERFLKFARATGQEAASSVLAFDDILDAWGLTAADSQAIMDKLIVSHQRYGGSITENQSALAKMAPQLKALNLTADDGIGLLNLFAASGLDAAAGQKALTAAITKLPAGESLDAFIARLSTVQDDGERAKLAMEVFGDRAGPAFANAIRPGMDSLEAFKIGAEDVEGATEDAAAALDGTFGARLQLLMKGAGSALTGFGANFGPALTGIASFASLAGSLGGGRAAAKFGGALLGGLSGLSGQLAPKLGAAFASSSVSSAIAGGLGDSIGAAGSSPRISGGMGKLSNLLGSKLGAGVSVAFAAAAVAGVIETYNQVKAGLAAQTGQIDTNVDNQVAGGTTQSLLQSKAALEKGLEDLNGVWDAGIFTNDSRKALEDQLATVEAEIARRSKSMAARPGEAFDAAGTRTANEAYELGREAARALQAGWGVPVLPRPTFGPAAPTTGNHTRHASGGLAMTGEIGTFGEEGIEIGRVGRAMQVDSTTVSNGIFDAVASRLRLGDIGAAAARASTMISGGIQVEVNLSLPGVRDVGRLSPRDLDDLGEALGERVRLALIRPGA